MILKLPYWLFLEKIPDFKNLFPPTEELFRDAILETRRGDPLPELPKLPEDEPERQLTTVSLQERKFKRIMRFWMFAMVIYGAWILYDYPNNPEVYDALFVLWGK